MGEYLKILGKNKKVQEEIEDLKKNFQEFIIKSNEKLSHYEGIINQLREFKHNMIDTEGKLESFLSLLMVRINRIEKALNIVATHENLKI